MQSRMEDATSRIHSRWPVLKGSKLERVHLSPFLSLCVDDDEQYLPSSTYAVPLNLNSHLESAVLNQALLGLPLLFQ